ncbi:hypothetical protein MBT84_32840 [Streptomyces sp. MBT84]|uniref:hypothetical protein n=1 Tax=Streptomyces sp. MBT84 TaxID=1488414 RepID=UPI001C6EB0A6|nr:hypothetical protein [Streptomyces sp. MBT84]MBW8704397.1 hypothetical protein [Streptomyces sp. MBT84]
MAKSAITQPVPSAEHVLNAPLEDLLAEFDIELDFYAVDEPDFTGIAVVKGDKIRFILPAGRPDAEREIVARAMLGQTLHVELPDLPEPYQLSEFDADGQPHLINPQGGAA